MSDQEATPSSSSTQPSSDERSQPRTNQPERGGGGHRGGERGRRRHSQQNQPHQPQRRPESSLNLEELRELVELIAQYGFTDFELEREGIRVRLRRELAAPTAPAPTESIAPPTPPARTVSAAPSPAVAQETPSGSVPTAAAPPAAEAAKPAATTDEDLHIITSPIVGTFYRAPSPTAEPFVRLGSHVSPDAVVCIIEAMKLMNEIQAETSGEVAKIYVENGQPVEYGQPLFGIKK